MQSKTVRITAADHAVLNELAKRDGKPMAAVLSDAIQELRRNRLLRQTNEAYQQLRQDTKAWEEEQQERRAWEYTAAIGAARGENQ